MQHFVYITSPSRAVVAFYQSSKKVFTIKSLQNPLLSSPFHTRLQLNLNRNVKLHWKITFLIQMAWTLCFSIFLCVLKNRTATMSEYIECPCDPCVPFQATDRLKLNWGLKLNCSGRSQTADWQTDSHSIQVKPALRLLLLASLSLLSWRLESEHNRGAGMENSKWQQYIGCVNKKRSSRKYAFYYRQAHLYILHTVISGKLQKVSKTTQLEGSCNQVRSQMRRKCGTV